MSKKVQYQRKEVMSQSSDSEDPLQLRRSLDSEDEDSAPASHVSLPAGAYKIS